MAEEEGETQTVKSQEFARPPQTKPFALTENHLQGASIIEAYDKYQDFREAKEMHSLCMLYATSYSEIMMKRLESEKPEFFVEATMTRPELVAHLTNNMCLPYSKIKAKMMRDTSVKIKENDHLKDDIRRLSNGGDRFHPYF
jgi:hypothetical protein